MTVVVRGQILTFGATAEAVRHESQGAIAIADDGTILWSGPRSLLPHAFRSAAVEDYGDCIVMPGFIDAHIHFPQYRMLAALYVYASARAGHWLIPAFHSTVDDQIPDAHDDPQNFDLALWAERLRLLLDALTANTGSAR